MTSKPDRTIDDFPSAAALPRHNGELVFEAPWEGRVFALAVALHERGQFTWNDFATRLAGEITTAEATGNSATYYERWLAAFEAILRDKSILHPDQITTLAANLQTSQPHEHP